MDVLITYDLEEKASQESKHSEVKNAMKALGYFDHFKVVDSTTKKETIYYLPNTTLWRRETTATTAKNDLLKVAAEKKATVERLIATKLESWDAIPGKAYKS